VWCQWRKLNDLIANRKQVTTSKHHPGTEIVQELCLRPWDFGTMWLCDLVDSELWYWGPWDFGTLGLWHIGDFCPKGLWPHMSLAPCDFFSIGYWPHGCWPLETLGHMGHWPYGRLAPWVIGPMGVWLHGSLAPWEIGHFWPPLAPVSLCLPMFPLLAPFDLWCTNLDFVWKQNAKLKIFSFSKTMFFYNL
jgi:hypothetical protein